MQYLQRYKVQKEVRLSHSRTCNGACAVNLVSINWMTLTRTLWFVTVDSVLSRKVHWIAYKFRILGVGAGANAKHTTGSAVQHFFQYLTSIPRLLLSTIKKLKAFAVQQKALFTKAQEWWRQAGTHRGTLSRRTTCLAKKRQTTQRQPLAACTLQLYLAGPRQEHHVLLVRWFDGFKPFKDNSFSLTALASQEHSPSVRRSKNGLGKSGEAFLPIAVHLEHLQSWSAAVNIFRIPALIL